MLPSVRRRQRWLYYVVLPLLLAGFCVTAISLWILDTDEVPPVSGIDFDVDASGDFGRAVDRITLLHLARQQGAVPEVLPSTDSELRVTANGCRSPVSATLSVYPDPRWWLALRAGRRGEFQALAIQRGTNEPATISPGSVSGLASAAIPGAISHLRVYVPRGEKALAISASTELLVGEGEEFTIVSFRIPDRALQNILLRPVIGQQIVLTFDAPWVHPNGFLSCYVAIPALIEGQAQSLTGLGAEGLAIHSATSVASRGPMRGIAILEVLDGSIAASASSPPPRHSAITPTWTCHRKEEISELITPDCHASAVINLPQRKTWQQVLLIIFGAVASAGFVGFFDGLRQILVPFD